MALAFVSTLLSTPAVAHASSHRADGHNSHTLVPPVPPPDSLPGIDVSHHQNAIDWTQVAASGVRFAIAKASEGTGYIDPLYSTNRAEAMAAGIVFGAYHFARPDMHPFNPIPDNADREARADERRRTVGARASAREWPPAMCPFDLQQKGRHLCTGREHLSRPIVHRPFRIEDSFQTRPPVDRRPRQIMRHDIGALAALRLLAKRNGGRANQRAQIFFKPLAHEPWLPH